MGDFLKQLRKSVDKSVNKVGVKSNTILEINKVKGAIHTLKGNIQNKKLAMADSLYTMYLEGNIRIEECMVICEEIKALEKKIKIKEREIEKIKAKKEELLAEVDKERGSQLIITPHIREVKVNEEVLVKEDVLVSEEVLVKEDVIEEETLVKGEIKGKEALEEEKVVEEEVLEKRELAEEVIKEEVVEKEV